VGLLSQDMTHVRTQNVAHGFRRSNSTDIAIFRYDKDLELGQRYLQMAGET
jgi:hypothetical protein